MNQSQALSNVILLLGSVMNAAISIETNPDLSYNVVAVLNNGMRVILTTQETLQGLINTMSSMITAIQTMKIDS